MPKPLKRRRYPGPKPVTIRRADSDAPDVIRAQDFDAYQYQRGLRPVFEDDSPFDDYREAQRRLALQPGDVIAPTPARAAGLWWFVVHVDGVDRTVTARTCILGMRREDTFTFAEVRPSPPTSIEDGVEADAYRRSLGLPEPPRGPSSLESRRLPLAQDIGVPSLPTSYVKLLTELPSIPCHGYVNGCDCTACWFRRTESPAS